MAESIQNPSESEGGDGGQAFETVAEALHLQWSVIGRVMYWCEAFETVAEALHLQWSVIGRAMQ